MKCYGYETGHALVLCAEGVERPQLRQAVRHAWFAEGEDGRFTKTFSMEDADNGVTQEDRERVKRKFAQVGPSMFHSMLACDWAGALSAFARVCGEKDIAWYLFGSVSDAVRGVRVVPHDIDVVVHTRDFFRAKEVFLDAVVEPFMDRKDTFLVRYIGRLFFCGAMFDIVADEKMDAENHRYDKVAWDGGSVYVETLQNRYLLERQRGREDRIEALEEYMGRHT